MLWKTKNLFCYINRKGTILLVFLFSFLGLAFPKVSFAGWVMNLAVYIAALIPYYIVLTLFKLATKVATLCGSLINWVLSPNFINYSYTRPGFAALPGGGRENPVIQVGLNVTQSLANMILVLILIYIAIAIMLQIAGYETKKLLVTFIIIAVLVNFTPVICGLIVDASNIVMNFFVKDLPADSFAKLMASKAETLTATFDENIDYKDTLSVLMQMTLLVGFLFVLSLILLIFASIFLLRYIAIWLLVILSPIAFVFYIVPTTRQYFILWWKQFISWCFIGATCGFFLYLALYLVTRFETVPTDTIRAPGISGELSVFDGILPYFVAIAFLFMGLIFGLKTSAIGASSVINIAKARGRGVARRTGKGTAWVGKRIYEKGIKPGLERPVRWTVDKGSRAVSRAGNWKFAGLKPLAPLKWLLPEKVREIGNIRPGIEAAAKEAEKESGVTSSARILTRTDTGVVATGRLIKTLKKNDSQDVFNEARKIKTWQHKDGTGMSDQEILETKEFYDVIAPLLKHAAQGGMLGTVLRRDPRLAKIANKAGVRGYKTNKDGSKMTQEQAVAKAVSEAREHIKDWEPESLKDPEVLMAALAQFDRDRWLQVNRQVKNGQNTALETLDEVFSKHVSEQDEYKGMSPEKIEGIFKNKPEKKEAAWKNFRKDVKKVFGNDKYFTAVKEDRMIKTSWREAEFKAPMTGGAGETTQSTSPGEAVMGKVEEEVGGLRKIGEKGRKLRPVRSISEKKQEEKQTLRSIGKKKGTTSSTYKQTQSKAEKAQVPVMITQKMKKELKEKGYSDEDIREMTPEEAWKNLGGQP